MKVIGLDIGTTSICGAVYDVAGSRLLQSLTMPNRSSVDGAGISEGRQDPEVIYRTVEEIIQCLKEEFPEIAAIGLTGQMHGILYINRMGEAASPLYSWQDQSGLLPAEDGATIAEHLSWKTGYPLSTGFGLVTHAALCHMGQVPYGGERICTIADYVAMRLSNNRQPAMDATNAASIGFFDVVRGHFDRSALHAVGIDSGILPPVLDSTSILGSTVDAVPIINAIGDNQASVLGAVTDLRTSLLLNVGTGGQLSAYSKDYFAIEGLETRPFPGGGFLLVGASLAGGKSYAMLERFFRSVLEAFQDPSRPDRDVPELYERMEELIDLWQSQPVDPLVVRTLFFGTRVDPYRRGAIEGIGPGNFTPAHLIYGFLQGIAAELHDFYLLLPERIREECTALVGAGNGLRRNRKLRSICEAIFGLPIQIPAAREEAALGAARHAGIAIGDARG